MASTPGIDIRVKGKIYKVSGGEWFAMKSFISDRDEFPGRQWLGFRSEEQVWQLWQEVSEVKEKIEEQGWHLISEENRSS